MFFQSWSEFFHMGGYGFYVWLSYGLSFLAIFALGIQDRWRKKALIKAIYQAKHREERQQMRKEEKK